MKHDIKLEQVLEFNELIRRKLRTAADGTYTTYGHMPFEPVLTWEQAQMALDLDIRIGIASAVADEDGKAPNRYTYTAIEEGAPANVLERLRTEYAEGTGAMPVIDPRYELIGKGVTTHDLYELCVHAMTENMEFMLKNHTRVAAAESSGTLGEWALTDDDCSQCRRRRPDIGTYAYELIQVCEFPNHFRTAQAVIYPSDYTVGEVLDALASYGYDLKLFLQKDGMTNADNNKPVFDWEEVVEMLFEMEAIEFVDEEFSTFKKAQAHVKKATGLKLV